MNQEKKSVIICGAGGHARVVADSLLKSKRNIIGFIAPEVGTGEIISSLKILGDDSYLKNFSPDEIILANGIGSLAGEEGRIKFALKMRDRGYRFTTVVHLSAIIAEDVKLEEGVQVMAGSVIQNNVSIGTDTIINTGAVIDHDCKIERDCHIAPGVVCSGGVFIDQGVHLGTGSKVIQNISIGKKSVIAAGSVIYKDVPANQKIIQKRYS